MSKGQRTTDIETLWFTRCAGNGRGGVPTATGIAHQLGLFRKEFARDGFRLRTLQDDDAGNFRYNHYDHELTTLIREGGNLFSIPARAQGAAAYRDGFHLSLAPDLSGERVELFRQQKDWLLKYGILDRDFDYDAWVDRRPIEEAARTLSAAVAA